MKEISRSVAFWIFDMWRKTAAQLQVDTIDPKSPSQGSPAVISRTLPNAAKVSMLAVTRDGQNVEWSIDMGNCRFFFGVTEECAPFPEFAEGKWVSFLSAQFPEEKSILFRERFTD